LLARTKYFPQQAFYPIAPHCAPHYLARYNQPQSRMRKTIWHGIYLEKFAADGASEPDNRSKLFRMVQAVTFGQSAQGTRRQKVQRKRFREN